MSVDAASALCCCDQVVTECCSLTSITMEITNATATFSCTIGQGQNPSGTTGFYTLANISINPFYLSPRVLTRQNSQISTAGLCGYQASQTYTANGPNPPFINYQIRACDNPLGGLVVPSQTVRWYCQPFRYNVNPSGATVYGQYGWEVGLRFFANLVQGSGVNQVTRPVNLTFARRAPLLTPCPLGLQRSIGDRYSYVTRQRGLTRLNGFNSITYPAAYGEIMSQTSYGLWNGQEAATDAFDFVLL